MRLFVRPKLGYALSALVMSFLGAVAIGGVVSANSSLPLGAAALWVALVAVANGLTMAFNAASARRPIPDEALERLTMVKALCNVLQGLAWGFGVPVLNVPGEAVTVIAPAWAMVTGVSVLVFSSAPWPPGTYTFITALFLPAILFLLTHSGALEFMIGITMTVCFPFCLLIGRLGAGYVGDLVAARLSVDALLERESRLSARLKQLNDERTRFFSSASHDLRQPLQALSFYITLIGLSPGRAEQRDLLSRLIDCADTLDRQFNAILGVASADAAVERAEARPVLLQPVVERAMASHSGEADGKGLSLRCVPTRAVALAAPDALERILSNLIGNAVRHTRTGGVVVGVRPRGANIALIVADSGIGIADADQARIFDDFFQVANPERNSAKGFGLGLAIVKRLAEGLGWPIELSSRPGRGSVFCVIVPKAGAMADEPAPDDVGDKGPIIVSALPALVLDDDGLVRDAMSRLLRSWQVEHRVCADLDEAMAILDAAPDRSWCVLLDYRLERGVTGIDVLDAIRRRHGDRHRFLLISGEADPALDQSARERGILVLRKPLKPIRLRAALSGLTAQATQSAAAGEGQDADQRQRRAGAD
jgi:signal transduction histidine kinase/FixJ family two-component response regulator